MYRVQCFYAESGVFVEREKCLPEGDREFSVDLLHGGAQKKIFSIGEGSIFPEGYNRKKPEYSMAGSGGVFRKIREKQN